MAWLVMTVMLRKTRTRFVRQRRLVRAHVTVVAMAACLSCWRIVLVSKFHIIHSRQALGSEEVWQCGQQLALQSDAKSCPYACPGFGKLEKRVRTAGGGASGSVRNLRIREDTAKYLLNLDPSSAHYDPKSRSMREDPLPYKVCPSPP